MFNFLNLGPAEYIRNRHWPDGSASLIHNIPVLDLDTCCVHYHFRMRSLIALDQLICYTKWRQVRD